MQVSYGKPPVSRPGAFGISDAPLSFFCFWFGECLRPSVSRAGFWLPPGLDSGIPLGWILAFPLRWILPPPLSWILAFPPGLDSSLWPGPWVGFWPLPWAGFWPSFLCMSLSKRAVFLIFNRFAHSARPI